MGGSWADAFDVEDSPDTIGLEDDDRSAGGNPFCVDEGLAAKSCVGTGSYLGVVPSGLEAGIEG